VSVAELRDADGVVRGSAAIVDGKVVYTPPTDWSGSVSLSYTLTDGASTSTATVTIVVQPAESVTAVAAAGASGAAPSPAGGTLPKTGFSALAPLGAVALLLLAGLGALLVRRRAGRVS
jgi:LPXTG-motif cell wall-anchored protein